MSDNISPEAQDAALLEITNYNASDGDYKARGTFVQRAIDAAKAQADAEIAELRSELAKIFGQSPLASLRAEISKLTKERDEKERLLRLAGFYGTNGDEVRSRDAEIAALKEERDELERKWNQLGEQAFGVQRDRDALRARLEAMTRAIKEAVQINREVNKVTIGNFYLAETVEGFLALDPVANEASEDSTRKEGDEPCKTQPALKEAADPAQDAPIHTAQSTDEQPVSSNGAPSSDPTDAPETIVSAIMAEVNRATVKFPTWPTDPNHAFAVVGEEYGETLKEVLQLTYEPHKSSKEAVRKEATQLAAMVIRFLMSLDRYEYVAQLQHSQPPQPADGARDAAAGKETL